MFWRPSPWPPELLLITRTMDIENYIDYVVDLRRSVFLGETAGRSQDANKRHWCEMEEMTDVGVMKAPKNLMPFHDQRF